MDQNTVSGKGEGSQPTSSSSWTMDVSDVRTVKVSNVAEAVSERDIYEFFSFSGMIEYIEMQRETETTKVAFITFRDSQGADTAALLTGATISGLSVSVALFKDYQLPPGAVLYSSANKPMGTDSTVNKAEDVVSTMLAKGFILGKDALNKAKAFDEKHQLTSNASARVAILDRRMGLSQKISVGTAVVNEKVREMDERYQVLERTKSALAAAEQKASNAGSAIMSNRYMFTGALWVTSAITAVSKAAEEVSVRTKEKVEKETKEGGEKEKAAMATDTTKGGDKEKTAATDTTTDGDEEKAVDVDTNEGNESPTIPVISADGTNKRG